MTKELMHRQAGPSAKGGVNAFLRKNCMPTLIEDIIAVRSAKLAGNDAGRHPYWKAVGKLAARTATSAVIQFGSTSVLGSLSWQTKMGAPSTNSLDNASPMAKAVAITLAGLVPPAYHELSANISLWTDMVLSMVRIGVEQVVWRMYKITPDFPGTIISPLVIGAAELAYKGMALANAPADPTTRFRQGVEGVFGNLVRLGMAAVIMAFGSIRNELKKAQSDSVA
jgi:hypothetical protein